jgi:hypothetical protein
MTLIKNFLIMSRRNILRNKHILSKLIKKKIQKIQTLNYRNLNQFKKPKKNKPIKY